MPVKFHGSTAARTRASRTQGGFTLLEVMITILVMAFGLLGFALLQTTSVRFTQSANQRTQATNLAYELLDQMRANRLAAAKYPSDATFAAGAVTAGPCTPGTGTQSPAAYAALWKCQVVRSLGDQASALVTFANGEATVSITWEDQRWEPNGDTDTTFVARSRL